jgi:hypothetical protein
MARTIGASQGGGKCYSVQGKERLDHRPAFLWHLFEGKVM